jgi:hypothetical protein
MSAKIDFEKTYSGYDRNFSITVDTETLAKGLRATSKVPRNSCFLVKCDGAVGQDGILQRLEELEIMDTSELVGEVFPFPQIFVFTNQTIVCGRTKIYEIENNVLVHKITVQGGTTWSAIDLYDYVYLSNGVAAVVREAGAGNYSLSNLPTATAICNYNGQVIIGAPNVTWVED